MPDIINPFLMEKNAGYILIIIAADLVQKEVQQQNTFKPQNVHQISKNETKTQGTGVKCKMEQSK